METPQLVQSVHVLKDQLLVIRKCQRLVQQEAAPRTMP